MASTQSAQSHVPQDIVTRVGAAAGRVARIQQEYAMQAEAESVEAKRQVMAEQARSAAEQVLEQEGLSIDEYNSVLTAAETDQDLERRLLEAAREAL